MKPAKTCEKFKRTMGEWRERLGRVSEADFVRAPAEGAWSLGRICHHLSFAHTMLMEGAAACAGDGAQARGGSAMAAIMCWVGSFPPTRFKIPPDISEHLSKMGNPDELSKSDALAALDEMERTMNELCDKVAAAPKSQRVEHFAAGWLTAAQWYQVAEMHLRHHLRQLKRTERALASA